MNKLKIEFKFPFILLIVLSLSCSKKSNEESLKISELKNNILSASPLRPRLISIEEHEKDTLKFSEIIDYTKLVQLETNSESIIGHVDKLICSEDYFFILDRSQTKSLFCFSDDGQFVHKINAVGRGPGEFLFPSDFWISETKKEIEILDHQQKKILVYSFKGVFLREFKLPMRLPYLSFSKRSDGNYLIPTANIGVMDLFPELAYNLLLVNAKGNILSRNLPFNESEDFFIAKNPNILQAVNENKVNYTAPWSNQVYTIEGDSVFVSYEFDFGKYGFPSDRLDKYRKKFKSAKEKVDNFKAFQEELWNARYCHGPYSCIETEDLVFFSVNRGNKKPLALFLSKKTDRQIWSVNWQYDMQLGYALPHLYPIAKKANDLVGIIYPHQFLENYASIRPTKPADRWDLEMKIYLRYDSLYQSMDKNNNPILAVSKMMDF